MNLQIIRLSRQHFNLFQVIVLIFTTFKFKLHPQSKLCVMCFTVENDEQSLALAGRFNIYLLKV